MKDKLKIIEQSSNVKVSVITTLASESTMDEQGFITVNRSYKLKCYPTFSKSEIARYTINRFNNYLNDEIKQIQHNFGRTMSTKGKGQLFNKAQYVAKDVLSKAKKSAKASKTKYKTPIVNQLFARASVEPSKDSKFDYFIVIENQFEKSKVVRLPAKSHKALNTALRNNWELSKWGDLHYDKVTGDFTVIVFVSKQVPIAKGTKRFVGVDVGLNHAYTSSDGFKSHGLKSIRKQMNKKIADRQRYKIKSKKVKTSLKQKLDRYAHEIVNRVQSSEIGLSFEAPIVISRLSKGTLQGWAGGYLAKRVNVLAKETSKYVVFVNPAYTSQECPKCHYKSKRNRKGIDFQCRMCDYKNHADLVGAINISRRASSEQKFDPATLAINSERDARKL